MNLPVGPFTSPLELERSRRPIIGVRATPVPSEGRPLLEFQDDRVLLVLPERSVLLGFPACHAPLFLPLLLELQGVLVLLVLLDPQDE